MKKKNNLIRLLSLVALLVLVAAMTISLASCEGKKNPSDTSAGTDESAAVAVIKVTVVHGDGSSKVFSIDTTEGATLRSALESIDLVEGDESEFGLYVKVVDGERADYDKDGAYWGFSQNGQYMMEGIDTTYVKDGDKFEIAYTKS